MENNIRIDSINSITKLEIQVPVVLESILPSLKFYHGSLSKVNGNEILANAPNLGNKLEDPKFVVYMWRNKEYCYSWNLYNTLFRAAKDLGLEAYLHILLDVYSNNLGVIAKNDDNWEKIKEKSIGKKSYVYTITQVVSNVRLGHSSYLPEYTSVENCKILKEEIMVVTEQLIKERVRLFSKSQMEKYHNRITSDSLDSRLDSNRGLLSLLMHGDQKIFPVLKRVKKLMDKGEVSTKDNLAIVVDLILDRMRNQRG